VDTDHVKVMISQD